MTGRLKGTILNFHEGTNASLDDDNMVKPSRDALNGLIYVDDKQIRYLESGHIGINDPIRIRRASAVLLAAYHRGQEFVYVRIDDAPAILQLPG